jgi:hypothetical protein
MIGSNKSCRPESNFRRFWWGAFVVGTVIVALIAVSFGMETGGIPCLLYAVAATTFLVGQVIGFVASQVEYSEAVEKAKFDMLEREEADWAHWEGK